MPRTRLSFERWPTIVYAIGDVHGCLTQLVELERRIEADAAGIAGEKWMIALGDYVDRGPRSAQVIEHLLQPPPAGFTRFCLVGNHEQMMLDFLDDPVAHAYWLDEGGIETLDSYGIDLFALPDRPIPAPHMRFLRELPISLSLPGWYFVHAGIRPGVSLSAQVDEDLIWIREPFLGAALADGLRVVHGHTPGPLPVATRHRICVDTQCFRTGRLTAARITPDGAVDFLSVAP
jgi:serine/threonine protein phosphatase 1